MAFAQQQTVSGTVYDESGQPLIGVSIQEKGTTNGVVSDLDGQFSMDLTHGGGGGVKPSFLAM